MYVWMHCTKHHDILHAVLFYLEHHEGLATVSGCLASRILPGFPGPFILPPPASSGLFWPLLATSCLFMPLLASSCLFSVLLLANRLWREEAGMRRQISLLYPVQNLYDISLLFWQIILSSIPCLLLKTV